MHKTIFYLFCLFFFNTFSMIEEVDLEDHINFQQFDYISAAIYYPDSKIILISTNNFYNEGTIYIFDIKEKKIETLCKINKWIKFAKAYPEHDKLISALYPNALNVYNFLTNEKKEIPTQGDVNHFSLSNCGNYIIIILLIQNIVKYQVLDLEGNRTIEGIMPEFYNSTICDITWLNNMPVVAVQKNFNKKTLYIYRLDRAKEPAIFSEMNTDQNHQILDAQFSKSKNFLAICYSNYSINIINIFDYIYQQINLLVRHIPEPTGSRMHISDCESFIIFLTDENNIHLIDLQFGLTLKIEVKRILYSHKGNVIKFLEKEFLIILRQLFLFPDLKKGVEYYKKELKEKEATGAIEWNFPRKNIAKVLRDRELGKKLRPQF